MPASSLNYIEPLTDAGERAAAVLTDAKSYGRAIAYHAQPCLVIYSVPAWIMPNGMVRVGTPNAPLLSPDDAARAICEIRDAR